MNSKNDEKNSRFSSQSNPVPFLSSIASKPPSTQLLIWLYYELRNRYLNRPRWICYLRTSTLFEVTPISLQEIHEAKTQSVINYLRVLHHRWHIDAKSLYAAVQIVFQKKNNFFGRQAHEIKLFNQDIILKDLETFSMILMGDTSPVDKFVMGPEPILHEAMLPIQTH